MATIVDTSSRDRFAQISQKEFGFSFFVFHNRAALSLVSFLSRPHPERLLAPQLCLLTQTTFWGDIGFRLFLTLLGLRAMSDMSSLL